MQSIEFIRTLSNQILEKGGFRKKKGQIHGIRFTSSELGLQTDIQTIFRTDIYRIVGDSTGSMSNTITPRYCIVIKVKKRKR